MFAHVHLHVANAVLFESEDYHIIYQTDSLWIISNSVIYMHIFIIVITYSEERQDETHTFLFYTKDM